MQIVSWKLYSHCKRFQANLIKMTCLNTHIIVAMLWNVTSSVYWRRVYMSVSCVRINTVCHLRILYTIHYWAVSFSDSVEMDTLLTVYAHTYRQMYYMLHSIIKSYQTSSESCYMCLYVCVFQCVAATVLPGTCCNSGEQNITIYISMPLMHTHTRQTHTHTRRGAHTGRQQFSICVYCAHVSKQVCIAGAFRRPSSYIHYCSNGTIIRLHRITLKFGKWGLHIRHARQPYHPTWIIMQVNVCHLPSIQSSVILTLDIRRADTNNCATVALKYVPGKRCCRSQQNQSFLIYMNDTQQRQCVVENHAAGNIESSAPFA